MPGPFRPGFPPPALAMKNPISSSKSDMPPYSDFREAWPLFHELVCDFPDFRLEAALTDDELATLEKQHEFAFAPGLKKFFKTCSALAMNGLEIRADRLGVIFLPDSPALLLGYLNLGAAADRLLMLPNDDALYYLQQHNGAITKIAQNLDSFFNETLPRRLYG